MTKHALLKTLKNKREKNGQKIYFKKMAENILNLSRNMDIKMSPNILNPKKTSPWHIIIKLSKIKQNNKILKTTRENTLKYKGAP